MSILKDKCSSIKKAKEYIRTLLERYKEDEIIDNECINELVQYHPSKSIDVSKVEWFKQFPRSPFRDLALFYKYYNNDKIDDFSRNAAIENLYGKYKPDEHHKKCVTNAFRCEVHYGAKIAFFLEHTTRLDDEEYEGQCEACNTRCKPTTDHKDVPFCVILERFLEEKKLRLEDLRTCEDEHFKIRLQDRSLAALWLQFHDEHASYRILCQSCNSHFGARGE